MAFLKKETVYAENRNWVFSEKDRIQKTETLPVALAVLENGRNVIKSGTPFPANDSTAIGLIYDTYDVTNADIGDTIIGSVLEAGDYYEDMLPVSLAPEAKSALAARGMFAHTYPGTTRE